MQRDDAFGEALLEYLLGDTGVQAVIERDDGLLDSADTPGYFAPPERWDDLDRWCCESLSGRLLDIGAGAGRHSLFLQERECAVTALDISPLAIEVCRRRGVRDVFVGSVEELALTNPEPFDGFLLLGNNLGLLRDPDYARRFLALLASIAAPQASLVGTNLDPYRSDNPVHLAYHDANRAAGRMAGQVRLRVRHRERVTPWMEYLFMSTDELRSLMEDTGWRLADQRDSGPSYGVRLTRDGAREEGRGI